VKVERSRHVVVVSPPAVERAGAVWPLVGPNTVVVCADHEQAAQWAAAAPPQHRAHAVTGLARSAALLKEGRVGLLAGAAPDLAALVARTALKLDAVETIVLAWPETFSDSLDTLLDEDPDARRVVLSWNPGALHDFLERHARPRRRCYRSHGERPAHDGQGGRHGGQRHQDHEDPLAEGEGHI